MNSKDRWVSLLADFAVAETLVPYACPCRFGPEDRYRLDEMIGFGRAGVVYLATDTKLSSSGFAALVAVKIMRWGHLTREASAMRRVGHAHVVTVLDVGTTPDGHPYLVTEYIGGGTLAEQPVPMSPKAAARFMAKVAAAVQAVHAAGLVHCDLKPANILCDGRGEPKVSDFELARWADDPSAGFRGNIAFMAPEQFAGAPDALTPPADIYALGGLLAFVLTGRPPHGSDREEVERWHRSPREIRLDGVPSDLARIVRRAMAASRSDRYHSAGELADDLNRFVADEVIPWGRTGLRQRARLWLRRHPRRAMAIVTAFILAGVGVGVVSRDIQKEHERRMRVEREATERTAAAMETLTRRFRERIRFLGATATAAQAQAGDPFIPPLLVWIGWLTDEPLLAETGRNIAAEERIALLQQLLDEGRAVGAADDFLSGMAQLALGHAHLDRGEIVAARRELEKFRTLWAPKLPPSDPFWAIVEVLELGADASDPNAEPRQRALAASALRTRVGAQDRLLRRGAVLRTVERILRAAEDDHPAP